MSSPATRPRRGALAWVLIALHAFAALGALAGGVILLVGVQYGPDFLDLPSDQVVESSIGDAMVAGAALAISVGLVQVLAVVAQWRAPSTAGAWSAVGGIALTMWAFGQTALLPFQWGQAAWLLLGLAQSALATATYAVAARRAALETGPDLV